MEDKKTIFAIAEKIAAHVAAKNKLNSIDPLLVIMIVGLIVNIVRLIYQCRANRDFISHQLKTGSWAYKFLLRKEINKQWKDKTERTTIQSAVVEVSKGLSEKELDELLNEALQEKDK